jgi:hypothetical protein
MPDHEFEKKIQDKMAELRLRPSEPVWKRVEQELSRKEKRRRSVVWLPLLLAALIGGYLVIDSASFRNDVTAHQKINTRPKTVDHVEKEIEENITETTLRQQDGVIKDPQTAADTTMGLGDRSLVTDPTASTNQTSVPEKKTGARKQLAGHKLPVSKNNSHRLVTSAEQETKEKNQPEGWKTETTASNDFVITDKTEPQAKDPLPSLINPKMASTFEVDIFRNINAPSWKQGEMKQPLRHKRKPEFGFSITLGRSHVSDGKLPSLFINELVPSNRMADFAARPTSATSMQTPLPLSYIPPSQLTPGVAFTAGGYVKKQVSKAFRVSAGLNYKLYSTANRLGARRDTNIVSNSINGALMNMDTKVYRTGTSNKYINRYHFIELPVQVEGRLINGKLPVLWNAGVSYSRLVASNALHYDNGLRVYYKNNKLLQKNQFNVDAGLTTILLRSAVNPLQVGPQFSYGITDILKVRTEEAKHFLFVGLKASMSINN